MNRIQDMNMNKIQDMITNKIQVINMNKKQDIRMNLMFDFIIRIGNGKPICQFLWKDELEDLEYVNTQCKEIIPIYVKRWGSKYNSYDLCASMIVVNDEKKRCSKVLDYFGLCMNCDKEEDFLCECGQDTAGSRGGICGSCQRDYCRYYR